MSDLGSDVDQIDNGDLADDLRFPLRKGAVAGWLYATASQIAVYVAAKLFGALTGQAGKYIKVNNGETGFNFGTPEGTGGGGGGGGGGWPMLYDLSKGVPEISEIDTFGASGQFTFSENPGVGLNVMYTGSDDGNPNIAGFLVDKPAGDFHVAVFCLANQSVSQYYGRLIGIHKSSASDSRVAAWFNNGHWTAGLMSYSDDHTRTSNTETGQAYGGWAGPLWLHVKLDSGTIYFGTSMDGVNPAWTFSESVTTYLSDFDKILFGGFFEDSGHVNNSFTFLCYDDDADARLMGTEGSGGGGSGGGGGGRVPFSLGTLRDLSDFTQVNISGTKAVTEYPGKAFTIIDTNPPADTPNVCGLSIDAPAAPYRVAAYVMHNTPGYQFQGVAFGHTDAGGKLAVGAVSARGDSSVPNTEWNKFSDPNTREGSGNEVYSVTSLSGVQGIWIGVEDDGTNVSYSVSADGASFFPFVTKAKSGGYLADYDKIFIGLFNLAYQFDDRPNMMTILDYDENGLDREPGGTGGGGGGSPMVAITQDDYDALSPPNADTYYFIID